MVLKEFPKITKNGDTLVDKSRELTLISDFVHQMSKRGNQALTYFYNPEKDKEENLSEDDITNGICWSNEFTPELMLHLIMSYANISFTPNQRKIFAKQIENAFLENELYQEEIEEYEDDYDEED